MGEPLRSDNRLDSRRPLASAASRFGPASSYTATLSAPSAEAPRNAIPTPLPVRPAVALRVLVVEDDPLVRQACADIATALGYLVETAESVPGARVVLNRSAVDVLLLDLKLPGVGGFSLLEEVRQTHPRTATVVMTAFATVNSAVEAMRTGAGDYLAKPFTFQELSAVLERAAERRNTLDERRALRERLHAGKAPGMLLGRDPAMEKVFRILSKVAFTSHPVLIYGEPGTGKESVARAIHASGSHATRPFVPVDCASLVPSLTEWELFGDGPASATRRGAAPKPGLLAAADAGTVFLDEVGSLSPELQARLIRALQDKGVVPLGGGTPVPVRARILAATNRDLPSMVETGRFRKDLFYKLNVVNIRVPPLRERRDDIALLAAHVMEQCSAEQGVPYVLSDDALKLMLDYDWPGNVRELESTIERACTYSSGPVVHLADLSTQLQEHRLQTRGPESGETIADAEVEGVTPIFELEKQAILRTLRKLNGDKLLAAKLLGIGKTTLYRKLKEYGLNEEFQ